MNSLWMLAISPLVRVATRCFMLPVQYRRDIRAVGGSNLVEFMFSLSRFFSASHRSDLGVA